MNTSSPRAAVREFKDHDLFDDFSKPGVRYEKRPAKLPDGTVASGLYNAWITLDNPSQFNSYTTDMVKGVILALRAASNARDVNCIVLTGSGDKAFCTGGNTKEYAEYYAGQPQEYRQYLRLFNDMVTALLVADKPVICRVNGMRIGGGQEIGMACDFSIAQDLTTFDISADLTELDLPGPEGAPVLGLVVHGDLQPVNASEWSVPPFSGTVTDGVVWGRGAADDKGPIYAALFAANAVRRSGLPLRRRNGRCAACKRPLDSI